MADVDVNLASVINRKLVESCSLEMIDRTLLVLQVNVTFCTFSIHIHFTPAYISLFAANPNGGKGRLHVTG